MFEGFDPGSKSTDRKRFGVSLAISMTVYLGIATSVVVASAAVRKIVQEEKLVQVEFKEPPAPEPPPPPPPEPPKPQAVVSTKPARAKVIRPELKAPDEIPEEKPAEAEGALPDAPTGDEGKEGFLTGVVGGTGTGTVAPVAPPPPPPPPPPKLTKSSPVPGGKNKLPEYPRAARRAGITGTVIARIHVKADGTIARVDILEGPDVFHDYVREALITWRYTPARLSNGQPVPDSHIVRIPFTLGS